jgi:hypothetical protein
VADNNIDLTATFDTSKATNSIKEFGSAASKSIEGLDDSFMKINDQIDKTSKNKLKIDTTNASSALDGLKTSLMAVGATVAAYFTASAISSFFSTIVSEAVDAENNLNQLNGAMQRTGEYTAENVASMEAFANAMARASVVDDDVINGQLALALNFTKSTEKAQELVKAAMDLSAATGISLDAAVEQLGKTLDGTAGRLNETVPALRGLSEEALKAGEGIKVVGAAFSGAALNQLNTFDGSILQAKNSFNNLLGTFGKFITKNPFVIQAINEISAAFSYADKEISKNGDSMVNLVNRGIISMITGIRSLLPELNNFSSFLKLMGALFDTLVKSLMNFVDSLKLLGNAWLWLVGTLDGKKSALTGIENALDGIIKRSDELAVTWANVGKDSFSNVDLKGLDDALKRIQAAADKKPIEIKTNVDKPDGSKIEVPKIDLPPLEIPKEDLVVLDQVSEAEKKRLQGFESEFQKYSDWLDGLQSSLGDTKWKEFFNGGNLDELVTRPETIIESLKSFAAKFIPALKTVSYVISRGLFEVASYMVKNLPGVFSSVQGLVAAMGQGAEGARKAIPDILAKMSEGIGAGVGAIWGPMGSAIGSGIGGIIGEQIKLASGDLKDTLAKIDEFATEVPNVIDKITKNLPEILTKINEKLPDIILAILKAIPPIMRAVAKSSKSLGEGIGENIVPIIGSIIEIAIEGIISGVMTVFNAWEGYLTGIFNYLWEKFAAAVAKVFGDSAKIGVNDLKEKLVGGLKYYRDKIVDVFKSISMEGLQNAVNEALEKLGSNITDVFERSRIDEFLTIFWDGLVYASYTIPKMLIDGIMSIFTRDNLDKMVQAMIDGIKDIFSISVGKKSDGGTGPVENALGVDIPYVGFATGGVVPSGYPNDSYPALLTSGETVVRPQTTDNLFKLIDDMAAGKTSGGESMTETNNLLRQLIAIIASQETTVDVKLDRNTLAKAILSLNNDNRRLA